MYKSRDSNRLEVADVSTVVTPAQSHGLLIPCLAMDRLPEELQSICVTIVNPTEPKVTLRKLGDHLENDLDYEPRNPETFEEDASFILRGDWFYPGYYSAEPLSMMGHMCTASEAGEIKITEILDTDEYHVAASFAVFDHSTSSTSVS